jgi:hypothetical protein
MEVQKEQKDQEHATGMRLGLLNTWPDRHSQPSGHLLF